MSALRLCLIVNPRSGGGATAGRLDDLRRAADATFGGDWDLRTTEAPGHATDLARAAAEEGFDRVVAVGGDGTANEVVNGLFDGRTVRRASAAFGIVHAGTGGDLVKTLKMPASPEESLRRIASAPVQASDVIHVSYRTEDGGTAERVCINVAGWGMNGEVVLRANRSSKRWGGRATFLGATIATIREYRPVPVTLTWVAGDGSEGSWTGPLSSAILANGQFCGGGMWVGRGGSMSDGLADLTLLPHLPLSRMILATPRLFSGTLDRVKGVSRVAVRSVRSFTESAQPIRIDIDGEQPGILPLQADVIEKSLLIAGIFQ